MKYVSNMMNFALKMMNFILKMMILGGMPVGVQLISPPGPHSTILSEYYWNGRFFVLLSIEIAAIPIESGYLAHFRLNMMDFIVERMTSY